MLPIASPLFRTAARELQKAARREFAQTQLGRLVDEAARQSRRGGGGAAGVARLPQAMLRYSQRGVGDALRELRGTTFGQLAGQVQRYSRGGGVGIDRLLTDFLGELGPIGKLLGTLAGTGGPSRSDTGMLIEVMRSLGYEVLSRPGAASGADLQREIRAQIAGLVFHGYQVIPPGEGGAGGGTGAGQGGAGGRSGPGEGGAQGADRPRQTVWEIPDKAQLPDNLPPDHPAVTGEMVDTSNSSNVHSVGYDSESSLLYVRFLGGQTQKEMQGYGRRARIPGALYRYDDVSFREFNSLLQTDSAGEWVWDHLRVRGSHAAHQKRYALVGIEGGYVPRRAGTDISMWTGEVEEVFKPRRVKGLGGDVFSSPLPTERAPDFGFGFGQVSWGMRPNRGAPARPDRGEPNRGGF